MEQQRGQHCAASKRAQQQGSNAEQQGKGAARSIAEPWREKKPLERPKRERAMYLKEQRGGCAMLISPHTMSKEGQPSSERRRWAVSNASAKAWGPAAGFFAYLQERWVLMTTRVGSPKRGTSSKTNCHQPRYLPCGPMGSAFNPVRLADSNALFYSNTHLGVSSNCSNCSARASWMAKK